MTSIYFPAASQTAEIKKRMVEHHNKAAGEIVRAIVRPIIDQGGSEGDAMTMLESVVVGVLLTMAPGGDNARLKLMANNAAGRLDRIRSTRQRQAH